MLGKSPTFAKRAVGSLGHKGRSRNAPERIASHVDNSSGVKYDIGLVNSLEQQFVLQSSLQTPVLSAGHCFLLYGTPVEQAPEAEVAETFLASSLGLSAAAASDIQADLGACLATPFEYDKDLEIRADAFELGRDQEATAERNSMYRPARSLGNSSRYREWVRRVRRRKAHGLFQFLFYQSAL